MIFGSKKHPIHSLLLISSLAIILTGCGGGGSESDSPTGSSTAIIQPSSTPVTATSSSAATSKSSSSSSIAKSSAAQVSSSSSLSSYVRSSRSSSTALEFTEEELIPEPSVQLDLPPSTPDNLLLQAISYNSALIGWQASTDDVALSYYEVRRDGVVIGTTTAAELAFTDIALTPNTYYTYRVRAIDSKGNGSNFSNALITKTLLTATNTSSSGTSSSNSSLSSSVTSSFSSVASSNSSSSSSVLTSVSLKWLQPTHRENGELMAPTDIGGYQIRYYSAEKQAWVIETIANPNTNMIILTGTSTGDTYEIATFDTEGLYSRFISLNPQPVQ
ncbi:MAG TPA: fibronectin type III domain-containing protein [Cellvibrio sp.]